MSRRYEPDPVRFTSMEDYEVCEKQLLDTLTHVVQRTSTMQQSIACHFANGVVEGWLPENEHNQSHLFDASANSNQLSSSSNQNNMSEYHVTNDNGEMFPEWEQAFQHRPCSLL
ncbi:hypothetical protein YC2023_058557 [Brassica napus]